MCGNGLHSFDDPANYREYFDKGRGQWRRRCRPCTNARKSEADARKREARRLAKAWWEQLEWTGPHRPQHAATRAGRRKRTRQKYVVRGHPIAYRVTAQQLDFLQGAANGETFQETAERLSVNAQAVRNGLLEVRRKYGVTSNAAAVAQGLKRGVIRADRVTAKRLPARVARAHVDSIRALIKGERSPYKSHRISRLLDACMAWTEPHAVSVLWAAGKITSRDVPQTRNQYRRRPGKRAEDAATWTTTMGAPT